MGKAVTLLRYPGGKSRAVKYLKEFVPKGTREICSPFFGGGALEISLANEGVRVYGYDNFKPLIMFWQSVIKHPKKLKSEVKKYYPLSKERFKLIQEKILLEKDEVKIGAMFFVLNRSSYSGLTLSGGMSNGHPRFNTNSIDKLVKFKNKNISVDHLDFSESIKKHEDKLLYCDPPYYIKSNNLYGVKGNGHKNFDHKKLFKYLSQHNNWILSYNNTSYIRELYADYEQITLDWTYGLSTEGDSPSNPKELIILNT